MSVQRTPLSAIRRRVRECTDEAELEDWCRRLSADPRAGARQVAQACERRLDRRRREVERLGRLFERTRSLRSAGRTHIAGVDEVGVGPLAGPVVAAAVVLPDHVNLDGLDDSKRVTPANRERLDRAIRAQACDFGIGVVEPEEIDRLDIGRASLEAMRRAVLALAEPADHLLVDARLVPGVGCPQTSIIGGDRLEGPIAAASIVAKVYRDGLMHRLDRQHPGYGFARHKGYGTAEHLAALRERGPSPIHRRSFAPVAAALSP